MSNQNSKWAAWQNVGKEVIVEPPKVKPTTKPAVTETPVVEPTKRIEMPLETDPVVPKLDNEVKPVKKLIKKDEE